MKSTPIAPLATLADVTVVTDTDIESVLRLFDEAAADEIAVVDEVGHMLGIVSEKHARRRDAVMLQVLENDAENGKGDETV